MSFITEGDFIIDGQRKPLGYQQITSLSSAVGFSIPVGSRAILFQAENKDIRFRDDGSNPTSSVGFLLLAGQSIWYYGDISKIKLIEASASAKVNALFYA